MTTSPDTSKKRAGLLLRAALPCLILVAGWWGFNVISTEVETAPPPPAEEAKLRTRVEPLKIIDYPVQVEVNSVVQAHNQVTLTSEVAGRVTSVDPSFEVGAYFAEGDLLVELDPRDYETALSVAESELAAAKSALRLARLNEERKLRLIESNAVSRAEVDVASATREQADADVDLAATQVKQAHLNLQRTKVYAPFDGRVQAKMIGVGQMAGSNSPLGEVFAIDFAEARLPISAEQRQYLELPELKGDAPIDVTLRDALNGSDKARWRAKIVRTEGALDPDSRDVFAIARIDDPFGRESGKPPLRIGQPVTASIEGEVLKDVIALPRGAVRQLDRIVLVDKRDDTLLPMRVQPVWSDAENVIVSGASLPEGMWLATTALPYAPEGSEVEIISYAPAGGSVAKSPAANADRPVAN